MFEVVEADERGSRGEKLADFFIRSLATVDRAHRQELALQSSDLQHAITAKVADAVSVNLLNASVVHDLERNGGLANAEGTLDENGARPELLFGYCSGSKDMTELFHDVVAPDACWLSEDGRLKLEAWDRLRL